MWALLLEFLWKDGLRQFKRNTLLRLENFFNLLYKKNLSIEVKQNGKDFFLR